MPRDVDERKKRKALRKLRQAAARAEAEGGPGLSDWEKEFVDTVEERLETYGSAFHDLDKGAADEPLSALQTQKLKEIDKKSRGKGGFKQRKPMGPGKKALKSRKGYTPRGRDIHEDIEGETDEAPAPTPPGTTPKLVSSKREALPPTRVSGKSSRPKLRIIDGGK